MPFISVMKKSVLPILAGQSAAHTYEFKTYAKHKEEEEEYWELLLEGGKGLDKSYSFYFHYDNNEVGSFGLSPMPNCCGVVVVGGVYLRPEFRGTTVSRKFREMRNELIKSLGYSMAIATTVTSDPAADKNFTKVGYTRSDEFVNKRTGNPLVLGWKVLK